MRWNFWRWLFRGLNDRPGLRQIFDWWFVAHILIGLFVSWIVDVPVDKAAQIFLLPLAGIFIGLSFAWVGNAQALLQESEIERVAQHHPDGIETYVYTFQLAILVILITLVGWGLAGLRVFEHTVFENAYVQNGIEATLYALASLTLRECWHVVIGSQLLILSRHKARNRRDEE